MASRKKLHFGGRFDREETRGWFLVVEVLPAAIAISACVIENFIKLPTVMLFDGDNSADGVRGDDGTDDDTAVNGDATGDDDATEDDSDAADDDADVTDDEDDDTKSVTFRPVILDDVTNLEHVPAS